MSLYEEFFLTKILEITRNERILNRSVKVLHKNTLVLTLSSIFNKFRFRTRERVHRYSVNCYFVHFDKFNKSIIKLKRILRQRRYSKLFEKFRMFPENLKSQIILT